MRICFVVSSPKTITAFLIPLIRALSAAGHEVAAVANTQDQDLLRKRGLDVDVINAPIERTVAPLRDSRAVLRLRRIFRSGRYDVVHSVTSKVGVLAMQAAWLARVPVRVHCYTGQSWANRRGWKRRFLKAMDGYTASLSTDLLADSPSQRAFLEQEGVVRRGQVHVLGQGSISGVDCDRFQPDAKTRSKVRSEFGIADDDVLILFLARVRSSKGVPELAQAFRQIERNSSSVHLAVVGPTEEEGMETLLNTGATMRVHRVKGFVSNHERYLLAADIFCLPSHYEGFGCVVIEAAACGVPAVAASVYGLTDAVSDGQTGLLHKVGSAEDLASKLTTLVGDPALRSAMGKRARERAVALFSQSEIIRQYLEFYRRRGVC